MRKVFLATIVALGLSACSEQEEEGLQAKAFLPGPYTVASTNLRVADEFSGIGDEAMHNILLGNGANAEGPAFLTEILAYPEDAWVTDVDVPDVTELYGPVSGSTVPVVSYVVYPSGHSGDADSYTFPYFDGTYGVFADMLGPGETPVVADGDTRFPLVIVAHGAVAHGVYEVDHVQAIASHGYIVVVITYGDDRYITPGSPNGHTAFLRPLLTSAVLDSLLESEAFGDRIDADNIAVTGHSYGGFTSLAVTGGHVYGSPLSVKDPRITAAAIAAPWVGHRQDGEDFLAFGEENASLANVTVPVISFYGTKDEATRAEYILPAMKQLSGPRYVIELVDQPHVFEGGSWEDRNNWELLFLNAFLKNDAGALETLNTVTSFEGGNRDIQHFDYQVTP